jgi:uncharacterized membrane protein
MFILTIYLTGVIIINWTHWIMSTELASDLYEAGFMFIKSVVWPILLPVLTIVIFYEWAKWEWIRASDRIKQNR